MSYDSKCYELAEHFLPPGAHEKLKSKLAQDIQTNIEDWLNYMCTDVVAQLGVPDPREG